MTSQALWIGTYPPAGIGTPPGQGEGVYRVELDTATGALGDPRRVVETPAPSFVVRHPAAPVLYVTDESERGAVAAFRVDGDRPESLGAVSSGGAYPCHLLVDGDRLYAANYGDGALGVLRLAADGTFASDEPQVLRHTGSGPVADRQGGPHAHFVAAAPGGHVLVVDLGTDEVRRYGRTSGGLEPVGIAATLPAGTGARHLVFRAGFRHDTADERTRFAASDEGAWFAYLTGELDATVHVLAWDPSTDTGELVQTVPAPACGAWRDPAPADRPGACGGDLRARWAGDATPAPSHLTLDAGELVVGVRGVEVLSRFTVGTDGLLTHRVDQPLPARVPRHFAVVGGWTVVAEQVPGAVTVLDRDGVVASSRAVPSAACVVPAM
ncbi:MAG TPA: beta-propeller fold lactonase family protein [Cellulomonas sp.]